MLATPTLVDDRRQEAGGPTRPPLSCNQGVCFMAVVSDRTESPSERESRPHPLDPLTRREITIAAHLLRAAPTFHDVMRFVTLQLHEPPKDRVLGFAAGDPMEREAFAVLLDP